MEIFEFVGEKYKKASIHQKEWGRSLISQLSLKGNEMILDLGCGDGVLTEQLSLLVPDGKVLGIDASIGMIKTAEQIVRDNLEFIHMDINKMSFRNEFNIIFSNAALHWIKDHNQLLKSSYHALKPHGVILWDFGSDGNCANFIYVIRKKMNDGKYAEYFKDFDWPWFMPAKSKYEKIISTIGFSNYEMIEVNRDRYFSNSDEMIKWIDQPCIVPFLQCIPERLKDSFRKEVIDEMLERTLQLDGTCFENFRRLKIFAKK